VAGNVIIDLDGYDVSDAEVELLQSPCVAGVILFSRNYQSPQQLIKLTQAIREANATLLICVDQEGGRVQRFREGFTRLPAAIKFGELYDYAPDKALQLSEIAGWLMASELLACGVDFSFAPVLDLANLDSHVIGDRAFHADPNVVIKLAGQFIDGMNRAGMAATGKHFPGHGSVVADSHVELPFDDRHIDAIQQTDMKVFAQLMPKLAAMMPAHVVYSNLDDKPASLSSIWLDGVLRKRMKFDGLLISDDLSMQAAVDIVPGPTARVQQALLAGCDAILLCNNRAAVEEVLRDLSALGTDLNAMRGQFTMSYQDLRETDEWQNAQQLIQDLV
tara:strand:- start:6365 stop:7363 length:999 start_codon:yes stop_codon:yes gene_type:complete